MKGRTHGRTNVQFENIMRPPASLAWWRHKNTVLPQISATMQLSPAFTLRFWNQITEIASSETVIITGN